MIAKVLKSRVAAVIYVSHKFAVERIDGTLTGSPQQLARGIDFRNGVRPTVKDNVRHLIIVGPRDDTPSGPVHRRLTAQEWQIVSRKHLADLGFDPVTAAWICVRHNDRDHDHVHIVVSRIDAEGGVVSDRFEKYKSQASIHNIGLALGVMKEKRAWRQPTADQVIQIRELATELGTWNRAVSVLKKVGTRSDKPTGLHRSTDMQSLVGDFRIDRGGPMR